jgi:hypothetical protein
MKRTRALLALLATGLLPGLAAAHSYTYVDGGVMDRNDDADLGIRMAGSAGLTPPLALFGEVVDSGNYSQLSAGAMFHAPVNYAVDLNLGGSIENVDTGRNEDTGLGLRLGMRWMVPQARGFELNPELRQVFVFNDTVTSVRGNALFPVTPNFQLQGALQAGDEDRIEFGMRYSFLPYGSTQQPTY